MQTYEITWRHPEGHMIIERIDAKVVLMEDSHIVFLNGGIVLSLHQDHCVSVRDIDTLGDEPRITFDLPVDHT